MAAGLEEAGAAAYLPAVPDVFVRVLHALTPELIDADVVRAANKAIFGARASFASEGSSSFLKKRTKKLLSV